MPGAAPGTRLYDPAVPLAGPLDLLHLGRERVIGSYLLDTEDGPALFDCGPTTCAGTLKRRLARARASSSRTSGTSCSATSTSTTRARPACSSASTRGCRCTSRRSARRTSSTRAAWSGAPAACTETTSTASGASSRRCPRRTSDPTGDRVVGLDCFPTPGHASHHVAYLDRDGTLLSGDATGVRIQPSTLVLPPTPPPDVDVEGWHRTLDEIERRIPERLALVHFGVADDVDRHLGELRRRLDEWAALVERGATEEEFVEAAAESIPPEERATYEQAMPLDQSYAGLRRWAEKRAAAA